MLVNCYPADAPGGHRVAVDPATGACTEILLMRLEPAHRRRAAHEPVRAAGGGYVAAGLRAAPEPPARRWGWTGRFTTPRSTRKRYGLLTVEDFLASRQNWIELNDGYQLSVFAAVG